MPVFATMIDIPDSTALAIDDSSPPSRRTVLTGLAAGLMSPAGLAQPRRVSQGHALLVGVGAIDMLPRRLWLRGPANDVALMRETLQARGIAADRIIQLSDATARPTRERIANAMATVLERVRPGERVVLHLAGHGVQVPQRGDKAYIEPDGLDEVFLTSDVERWRADEARLPNALMDAEIGAWIDAVVDRGAFVWAIFDTCHAAGMSRAGSGGARWRSVAGSELGVPASLTSGPASNRSNGTGAGPQRLDGRVLAYAARAHEATGEEYLPRGGGFKRAKLHGVFTFAIVEAVRARVATAEGLLSLVRQQYASHSRISPVPRIVGDLASPLGLE